MNTSKTETPLYGFWIRLKRLREKWVLACFLVSAIVWMESTVRDFATMPQRLHHQSETVVELSRKLTDLEQRMGRGRCYVSRHFAPTLPVRTL